VRRWLVWIVVLLVGVVPAWAHVGNKDVFEQVQAGPYTLFVTIRTPTVIPGVATVEVRTSGAVVRSIEITPLPLTGEASLHPPTADPMAASKEDAAFFTGSLWLMAQGSWQVRFTVDGAAGPAMASVPVPAVPLAMLTMQRPMELGLGALGVLLVLGAAGIVAAAVGEGRLVPGLAPTAARRKMARVAGMATLAFMALAIYLGGWWWKVEAADYAADIYHPAELHATLDGDRVDLTVGKYVVRQRRFKTDSIDALLPDHGHVMHLYAIRWPEMDAAFHLHPAVVSEKHLAMELPAMPPGTYRLYADIVRVNGFPETLVSALEVPSGLAGGALSAEDASAAPAAMSAGELGTNYKLPDEYTMVWDRPVEIVAGTAYKFRFRLVDAVGKPAADMQPYLGMAGHAAFVKADGSTFAHTHPEGSAAMQAVMLANGDSGMEGMPGMDGPVSPVVEFPYGFPSAGRYRVFVQMKHGGVVETGVFDTEVR
jgi:hypothetical protein